MPRYTRLRGDRLDAELEESALEYFELPDARSQCPREKSGGGEPGGGAVDCVVKRTSKDSSIVIGILTSCKLNNYMKGSKYRAQHTPTQNIENGNPNLFPVEDLSKVEPTPTILPPAALHGAPSLREKAGTAVSSVGPKAGGVASLSARWGAGKSAEDKSTSRCRPEGSDSSRNEESNTVVPCQDGAAVPTAGSGQWASSIYRVSSYREAHPLPQVPPSAMGAAKPPQQDTNLNSNQAQHSCNSHSLCSDTCQSERFSKSSSVRENGSSSPRVVVMSMDVTTDTKPLVGPKAPLDSSMSDAEYWESHGERNAMMRRSSSTRDNRPKSDLTIENWRDHPAARSARSTQSVLGGRHRVSFSLLENHPEMEQQQKEKWREPVITPGKALSAKNPDPLRYNYEQPGFVEREKDGAGKPYTIYGVESRKDLPKECPKECPRIVSGYQPSLSRAFSSREKGSTYTMLARTFSVNAGSHLGQSECVTCGRGLGVVVNEFAGNEVSFCKACKPSAAAGKHKKKGMLDYCRRLLGMSKKTKS